ncbi:MAG: ribonuclease P [Nanoarchaeota archaeon]|nr:ribonuclease P [Nanoarchaeota archaeon]
MKSKKDIANERIRLLVDKGVSEKNPRYVELARKIGMKTRVSMPKDLKFKFCKKCGTPFSADTHRVRINSKKNIVVYECLKCGHKTRFPYVREKHL